MRLSSRLATVELVCTSLLGGTVVAMSIEPMVCPFSPLGIEKLLMAIELSLTVCKVPILGGWADMVLDLSASPVNIGNLCKERASICRFPAPLVMMPGVRLNLPIRDDPAFPKETMFLLDKGTKLEVAPAAKLPLLIADRAIGARPCQTEPISADCIFIACMRLSSRLATVELVCTSLLGGTVVAMSIEPMVCPFSPLGIEKLLMAIELSLTVCKVPILGGWRDMVLDLSASPVNIGKERASITGVRLKLPVVVVSPPAAMRGIAEPSACGGPMTFTCVGGNMDVTAKAGEAEKERAAAGPGLEAKDDTADLPFEMPVELP